MDLPLHQEKDAQDKNDYHELSLESLSKRLDRIQIGEKPFKCCSKCTKSFCRADGLKIHMPNHTGDKPFDCAKCDKSFSRPYGLKRHEKSHKEKKPFACKKCEMRFAREYGLKRHERTHTGEKPYSCKTCHQSFSRSDRLQKHRMICEIPLRSKENSEYTCPSQEKLNFGKTHTGEETFKCKECGYNFSRLSAK